ncbi:MAG: biotin--[acetyl-CoA-carboxylase] ligase [Pirellulaceae bacterium]
MGEASGMYGFTIEHLEQIRRSTRVMSIEHHRHIPSTNTRALLLAEDAALALPALVLTDLQTAGRGRGDHRWWSTPGALTFSVVLPRIQTNDQGHWPRIALTVGLAVCESLQQLRPGLEIGLKWPNDVYVLGRKICGILVEVPPRAPDRIVVGMGLNVNNTFETAPPAVALRAISLREAAGYAFDLTVVLIRLLSQLAAQLAALARGDAMLVHRWQSFCMLSGRRIQVEAGQRPTVGICQGIDESGALLVDTTVRREKCVSGIVTVLDSRA